MQEGSRAFSHQGDQREWTVQSSLQLEPTSIAGYVSLALSSIALVTYAIGWGRWLEKLNGVGGRVASLETESTTARAEREQHDREIDRLILQNAETLRILGESKRSAERCSEETVDMGITIGSKIDTIARQVIDMNLSLSQRMKAVETVLKIRDM